MLRSVTIVRPDGRSASGVSVALTEGSHRVEGSTDRDGRCELDWPHPWVDSLEVDGEVVRSELDLSGGLFSGQVDDLGEVVVPRAGERGREERFSEGIRGRLYYSDGTQAFQALRLQAELPGVMGGQMLSTTDEGSYCRDDGTFLLATSGQGKEPRLARLHVLGSMGGVEIPSQMFQLTSEGEYLVILPAGFGKGGSDGGLITGRVLDVTGEPAYRCKVEAQVISSRMLSLGGGMCETTTDEKGRFQLAFTGGTVLKRIFIGGHEPAQAMLGRGESEREVPTHDVPAGSFGLTLMRAKKRRIFGS
jgi:hypothetical protein